MALTTTKPAVSAPRLMALGALSALLLTAACVSAPSGIAPATTLPPLSEAPARNGDYEWFLDHEDDEVQLFYGLANSDDIPLGLTCARGSGQINISTPDPHGHARQMTLTSGGQVSTYRATSRPAEVFDGYLISATTTPADPVMQAFAVHGWLAIAAKDRWVGLAGDDSTRQSASRFMADCKHQ